VAMGSMARVGVRGAAPGKAKRATWAPAVWPASRVARVVEVAGIEPASFSTSPGLLRAHPASLFSAPAVLQASRRRAQSLLGVPTSPATGLGGGSS
jgi:hypothetical protein